MDDDKLASARVGAIVGCVHAASDVVISLSEADMAALSPACQAKLADLGLRCVVAELALRAYDRG